MIKTINYFFKKRIKLIIIITIVLLLIAILGVHRKSYLDHYYVPYSDDYIIGPGSSPFGFLATIGGILATIMPIYEFSFKMKKVNIDQMYSLPVKREKLYLSRFIVGFMTILIPVSVLYLDLFINVAINEHMFQLVYFLPYYFVLVFAMLIPYTIYSFFFTRANTMVDGIVNMIAISFLLVLFVAFISEIFIRQADYNKYFIQYPLAIFSTCFDNLMRNKGFLEVGLEERDCIINGEDLLVLILMTVFMIVSAILFVFLNKKEKAENCMQVSNSWFSYKVMIPAYLSIVLILMTFTSEELISLIFISVAAYIAYMIYRRSYKLKKCDYIVLASCIVASIIVGIILAELIHYNYINK